VRRGRFFDYGIVAVVAIALALAVQAYAVKPFRIPSASMASTLRPGDRVLVNRVVYHLRDPHRGDVIVFRYPKDLAVVFIKRVVGVPGDTLRVVSGRLFVNGHRVSEPYVHRTDGLLDPTMALLPGDGSAGAPPPWSLLRSYTVPRGSYFVMGDNRTDSDDSRDWGVVPRGDIIGEGFFLYWPPRHWASL
jgi:signal peptidase I